MKWTKKWKERCGLNDVVFHSVCSAGSIRAMLKAVKPYLNKSRYKMLKRAVRLHKDHKSKRECILRYVREM